MTTPALFDVVEALTGVRCPPTSAAPWSRHDVTLGLPWGAAATSTLAGVVVPFGVARWRHADPAEALEALEARGLAPPTCPARGWWCARCGGSVDLQGDAPKGCKLCRGVGAVAHPLDVPTLAAVASLGVGRWLRAEELARVVAPGAVVAWRRLSDAAMEEHASQTVHYGFGGGTAARSFAEQVLLPQAERWPQQCPFASPLRQLERPEAAWCAIRSLALDCGVALVDDDPTPGGPARITLAAVVA